MSKVCKKCGKENPDSASFCEDCGAKLDSVSVDMSAMKDTVSDAAGKALNGAIDLVGQLNNAVSTTLENQKEKSVEAAQQEIAMAQKSPSSKKQTLSASGTDFMSSTELWSWLQKDSKRQHFYTEQVNTTTQAEYMQKLDEKLQANSVPASVAVRDVQWDRSDARQRVCYVQPKSSAVNPLSCLIQFNHVGKFTFVDEKTYITPPDLPDVPMQKVKIDAGLVKRAAWMFWGIIVVVIGCILFAKIGRYSSHTVPILMILAGGIFSWFGFSAKQKLDELKRHNERCEQQEKAWATAWDNWENSIFLHSFQENINGQISRIYDAVFECIKQLNEEMFAQKEPIEQQESQSMNELEQLIARRKDDYR